MPRLVELQWCPPCRWHPRTGLPDDSLGVGLYQITRVFGSYESLLYIGIVWSDTRTFRIRMEEHRKDWLGQLRGINYRFATITPLRGLSRTRQLVEEIEGALVFQTEPPENTSKVSSYSIRHDLVIINRGNRGMLPKFVDTTRH